MLYGAVLAFLWWRQESLLFFPTPLPPGQVLAIEPGVREARVEVEGATLSMLHLQLPAPRGVVFFLHGNAGNLASWFTDTGFYREANFDLVMPDYRGYGKSTGRITSARQLRADVRAAWDSVAAQYQDRPVVLYGRSLGTGLAADLAEQLTREGRPPALTVLVSPYASMRELTREFYPWVPPGLLRYPLDTAR
ncbi:MAG TPA: alpha/beta fold hydrolase, partial [Ramlibacter sp.]